MCFLVVVNAILVTYILVKVDFDKINESFEQLRKENELIQLQAEE